MRFRAHLGQNLGQNLGQAITLRLIKSCRVLLHHGLKSRRSQLFSENESNPYITLSVSMISYAYLVRNVCCLRPQYSRLRQSFPSSFCNNSVLIILRSCKTAYGKKNDGNICKDIKWNDFKSVAISDSASLSRRSFRISLMLPRTGSFCSLLITSSFSCTIILDMVCLFRSEWCAATLFWHLLKIE